MTSEAAAARRALAPDGRIRRLADWVRSLSGRRRAVLLVVLGLVSAAALPPLYAVPVLLVCFPLVVWALDRATDHFDAFMTGWWFGFGHFVAGLYWLAYAMLVDAAKFAWMIPFAVFGLSGVLAVFTGTATLLVRASNARGGGRILILAAAWVGLEWVRSWIFTGFPWNLIGTVWAGSDEMMQAASLAGTYGLGLLTILAAAAPAVLADEMPAARRRRFLAAAAALLAVTWAWGTLRLSQATGEMVPDVRLRLVQANVAQTTKWKDDLREHHLAEHVRLSRSPGFERVTHVIWPESAAPYFLDRDLPHRLIAAQAVPDGGLVITGVPRAAPSVSAPGEVDVWNSLQAIDDRAEVVATYDKVHLVPFGEYVPMRWLLPIDKITDGIRDFAFGPGLRRMELPGLPAAAPLICYEAIFPAAVVPPGPRPGWLLNVTNDGWFGISSGPHQHLAGARLRAVEEGLPLVRAANTGISAVTDAYGRTIARLGLGEQGVVDAPLPVALAGATPYGRFGDAVPLALIVLLSLAGLRLHRLSPHPG